MQRSAEERLATLNHTPTIATTLWPSRRQLEVAALLAKGLRLPEIARRLGITIYGVRALIYGHPGYPGLYQRIGATNKVQTAVWWMQHRRRGRAREG